MSSRLASLLLPAALLATACDRDSGTGDSGPITFTATECGAPVCDLDLGVAVGSSVQLAAEGLELVSSDPSIAEVYVVGTGAELIAWRAGAVELRAVDASGAIVDTLTVQIVKPDRIELAVTGDGVVGPLVAQGFDTMYRVPADASTEVSVTALAGDDPLIGAGFWGASMGTALAAAIAWADWRDDGTFTFVMPAGDHTLAFDLPDAVMRVRLTSN